MIAREAIVNLHNWERENIPQGDSSEAREILLWLLHLEKSSKPVGDLYKNVNASQPTIRKCLKLFVANDLAALCVSNSDKRNRYIVATSKLEVLGNEYLKQIQKIALESQTLAGQQTDNQPIHEQGEAISTSPYGEGRFDKIHSSV